MLLLILEQVGMWTGMYENLHSTMLLLIRSRGGYQDISKTKFTFHYASTYTGGNSKVVSAVPIYIPLCFYLYKEIKDKYLMYQEFTFHYASTYTGMNIESPE